MLLQSRMRLRKPYGALLKARVCFVVDLLIPAANKAYKSNPILRFGDTGNVFIWRTS
jgi:hypothetical protein